MPDQQSTHAFYAVKGRRRRGVYKHQADALAEANGSPNFQVKAFPSCAEASAWLRASPRSHPVQTATPSAAHISAGANVRRTSEERRRSCLRRKPKKPLRRARVCEVSTKGSIVSQTARALNASTPHAVQNSLPTSEGDIWVDVYTDGACVNNGDYNAKAGLGVWWGSGMKNLSERVPGAQTNNRAELLVALLLSMRVRLLSSRSIRLSFGRWRKIPIQHLSSAFLPIRCIRSIV